MYDERTSDSLYPLNERNSIKNGTSRSQLYQHRTTHATIETVTNNRYTTIYTLEIYPTKDDSVTSTPTVHRRIFNVSLKYVSLTINTFQLVMDTRKC